MSGRAWTLAVILPLLGFYGYRAAVGVPAGIAMARGNWEVSAGAYRYALPELRKAPTGFNRFDALWRLADSEIDIWENEARYGGPAGADWTTITDAARAYLEGICVAPASRRSWAGLALVYHKVEWAGRLERSARGHRARAGEPWAAVGRSGRIAVGLARHAVERAPNWYVHRDFLARVFWTYGLDDLTRESVREAARVMPIYGPHSYLRRAPMEEAVLDDFIEASRESLGKVPLVDPATQRIDLGKLELQRGEPRAAIAEFEAASELRLDPLRRAEALFHLGLALMAAGEPEEGRQRLLEAGEHAAFEEASQINLAYFAERAGEHERVLEHLRELRRLDHDNVEYTLRFAAAARELERWDAALEALRWSRLIAPRDPRPLVALVEIYHVRGDSTAANVAWRELVALDPEGPDTVRLRKFMQREARSQS
jgi:tetratricopeptide (TPR) repeat protein